MIFSGLKHHLPLLLLLGLALWCYSTKTPAALHGDNNIWAAPDNLDCLPWKLDAQSGKCHHQIQAELQNLIHRTGMTLANGPQGTGFLVGKHCDWLISTAHTLNHSDGKQRAPGKTLFFREPLNSKVIRLLNNDIAPITDLTDRKLTQLSQTATDQQLHHCPRPPLLMASTLRAKRDQLESCLVMSFNQDLGNPNASKRQTMTLRTATGLQTVSAQTRGITVCKVTGFAYDGMIETDCDSIYASSGSPLFCKAQGANEPWQLTGTLFADTCKGSNNYDLCFNPTKTNNNTVKTLFLPITEQFQQEIIQLYAQ